MDHADHLGLIRDGVTGAGPAWLELGAGEGAFTLALADLLGAAGSIVALDRDRRALDRLRERVEAASPATTLRTVTGDFRSDLPAAPFDGVLAANSLHFVADPVPVLDAVRTRLRSGGRLVVVEYDADRGNPWVPHPFSARRFPEIAAAAGFTSVRLLGQVPSRFLEAIWSAVAAVERPIAEGPVHSEP